MPATVVQSQAGTFSDGNAGHLVTFGSTAGSGNLLVLTVASDTVVSTPSGWTLPTNGSRVGGQGAYLFYKFATGSETGVTVTTSGNLATTFSFVEYSGVGAFDVATNVGVDGVGGSSTPSVTLTAAGAGELHVFVAGLHILAGAGTSPSWTGSVTQFLDSGYNATSPGEQQFYGHVLAAAGAATTTVASWSTQTAADRYTIAAAFTLAAVTGSPVAPARPGKTWLRRFKHRQVLPLPPSAGPSNDAPAEVATGSGTAPDAAVDIQVNAEAAAGTGTAPDGLVAITVNAEAATGTGTAPDATVSTSGSTNAPAEVASGTGTAPDPIVALGVNAEAASGTGTASDGLAAVGVQAEAATGTGTASDAQAAIAVNAGVATGTGTALDATVSTASQTNAPAEVASGTGTALDPAVAITVPAGAATGTGSALNATVTIGTEAPAGTASGTGTAFNAAIAGTVFAEVAFGAGTASNAAGATVAPFTIGALTAGSSTGTAFAAATAPTGELTASTAAGGPS